MDPPEEGREYESTTGLTRAAFEKHMTSTTHVQSVGVLRFSVQRAGHLDEAHTAFRGDVERHAGVAQVELECAVDTLGKQRIAEFRPVPFSSG